MESKSALYVDSRIDVERVCLALLLDQVDYTLQAPEGVHQVVVKNPFQFSFPVLIIYILERDHVEEITVASERGRCKPEV